MKRLFSIVVGCSILVGCVSEQEQREAGYRYEQALRQQCEQTLGFRAGTQGYMTCRMFYDEVLAYAFGSSTMSFGHVSDVQERLDATTQMCRRYWGTQQVDKKALWKCIQTQEQKFIDEAIHQKKLAEQEEVLTRSIAAGQKEANDDNRLQERIEAERERVAKEKGKSPKKIKCKTYNKSNGYVQVKCK